MKLQRQQLAGIWPSAREENQSKVRHRINYANSLRVPILSLPIKVPFKMSFNLATPGARPGKASPYLDSNLHSKRPRQAPSQSSLREKFANFRQVFLRTFPTEPSKAESLFSTLRNLSLPAALPLRRLLQEEKYGRRTKPL